MNISFYLHDEKDPVAFEKTLLWFKKHYTLVSSREVRACYYEGKKLKNTCHLTIDDGWLSTYRVIYPLLKKHAVPASIFVSPQACKEGTNFWYMEYKGYDQDCLKQLLIGRNYFTSGITPYPLDLIFKEMKIDAVHSVLEEYRQLKRIPLKERAIVNEQELKEMDASGLIEIGAHTMTHPVLSNEDTGRVESEIRFSIENLSHLLGRKVTTFAYPNGLPGVDFGLREMEIVKSCGIELAYSVQPGVLNGSGNPYSIPRTGSVSRLKLGRIGLSLPSLHDQEKPRKFIRSFKLTR